MKISQRTIEEAASYLRGYASNLGLNNKKLSFKDFDKMWYEYSKYKINRAGKLYDIAGLSTAKRVYKSFKSI